MKKITFIIAAVLCVLFGSCTKEEDPIIQQEFKPISLFTDYWYYCDSTDNYCVKNHINSICIERIKIFENEIVIYDHVTTLTKSYFQFHLVVDCYQTWYSFTIYRENLDSELDYLRSLKEQDGNFSIIKDPQIIQWMPIPELPWHNQTECWVTDDQIDFIINTIIEYTQNVK